MNTFLRHMAHWRPTYKTCHFSKCVAMSTFQPTYDFIEGVESLYGYQAGGFHPVNIGDTYHDRYRVVHKLGHGACSTIWLARDLQQMKLVALKIGLADWETNEAVILTALTRDKDKTALNSPYPWPFPSLLDHFSLTGPNGTHKCLVMNAARCSLAKSDEWPGFFHLKTARVLAAQITIAIHKLHSKGYIHNDLRLGNILLQLPHSFAELSDEQLYSRFKRPTSHVVERLDKAPLSHHVPAQVYWPIQMEMRPGEVTVRDAKILLSDFGVSSEPAKEPRREFNTPVHIRPPESRFEPDSPVTPASDIWCLACLLWDMVATRPLFWEMLPDFDGIINQHVHALGMLPKKWWDMWETRSEYFEQDGTPVERHRTPSWQCLFEENIQELRRSGRYDVGGSLDGGEKEAFESLLLAMLRYLPSERLTAQEVLDSEWMTQYALPELDRALPELEEADAI